MSDVTEPKLIRLGIAGFGRLAQNYYVPALRRLRGVRVVAVADPTSACCDAAKKMLPNVKIYPSQQAMLDAEQIDGLLVASPPSAHLASWLDAAARPGLAVFMEKPFVLGGELDAATRVDPQAAGRLMVNFNRRFWPRYQRIADIARSGAIGQVRTMELELRVDVGKWLSITQHRLQPREGGALYDLGSQMLDLACVISGSQPLSIRTTASSKRSPNDHAEVELTFANDVTARCVLAYDAPTRERICVRGTAGEIRIENPNTAVHVVRLAQALKLKHRVADLATLAGHAAARHTSMSRRTIELALAAFVSARRGERAFSPGFDDAIFSATLLEAAARSITNGSVEPIDKLRSEVLA